MKSTLIAALASVCLLGGCGPSATQVQAQAVYTLEGAYDAAALAERNYIQGTFGKPDLAIVAQMKSADNKAYALVVSLRADAQAGTPIAQTAIDAATTAVGQLKVLNTSVGAH